jgi:anti-sigma factor RsiW
MRHVDDGTLHAWLDAELPDTDAAIVASHLDGCARCRARLDAARDVRDQAGMLLDMASPAVEPADFDQLRARAGLTGGETASAGRTAPREPRGDGRCWSPAGRRVSCSPWRSGGWPVTGGPPASRR